MLFRKYEPLLKNGFTKYNYPNPIGKIYSTKLINDAANDHFNAFAVGGKSTEGKRYQVFFNSVPAGFSQIKREWYKRFLFMKFKSKPFCLFCYLKGINKRQS